MAAKPPQAPPQSTAPSPPPSVTPVAQCATLPSRINVATRRKHTELNRLLIRRLPLALPPHAQTPLLFSHGIAPFARIFFLFETEWARLSLDFDKESSQYSGHEYDLRQWLATLRPPGLERSRRLRQDLRHLDSIGNSIADKSLVLEDEWLADMSTLMRAKPHVLVAFAWVFYMAVFSGGRWIRQQLVNCGNEFWHRNHSTVMLKTEDHHAVLEPEGTTFLSFDGENDGEELKILFKTRLADAEWLLDDQEKEDIVGISQQLFSYCVDLVTELDRMVSGQTILS